MKYVIAIILSLTILSFFSQPVFSAGPDFEDAVQRFIKAVDSNDRTEIAHLVDYPLVRQVPLPSIDSESQFLQRFDEVFDEHLLNAISSSSVADDWADMGWRGIMFRNGMLWLNENGKITAVNYQTEKEKSERVRLIEAERLNLHSSLQQFMEPVLEWKTKDYRIRIDRTGEVRFRYAVWPVQKATSEKPDLILDNGTLFFDGSGGNHHYDFKGGVYLYRCSVNIIGSGDEPAGLLEVFKNDKSILSQPVIEVVK